MSWLRRALLIIVCLLIGVALGGAAYQAVGYHLDARRSPEPGRLVDIGGYRLNINCLGAGDSTVILESGLGDISVEWQSVQTEIAKFARVCSYDRAGYGSSDPVPTPRTSRAIAGELHRLLQNAGEKPPFILVGHSFGGYNVRVFEGNYPGEVAGLVLVDSPQEDQYEMLPSAWKRFDTTLTQHFEDQAKTAPFLIGLGIARLMLQAEGGLQKTDYLLLQAKYLKARASELANIQISAKQARAVGKMGNKALIVLAAGRSFTANPIPGLSPQDVANSQRIWIEELQPRLASLSTRGKLLVLPDVGHNIPAERPDAIVEAVREITTAGSQ